MMLIPGPFEYFPEKDPLRKSDNQIFPEHLH